ncbi:MAG: PQQ-dependent sugar dehydrogenase [Bdellovibrionaceae bacterium]|nr:PQQ-dependent sugar dehydrogenase [Bdellovibrio sp.]
MKNLILVITSLLGYFLFLSCRSLPKPASPASARINVSKTPNEVSYGYEPVRSHASHPNYKVKGECNGLPRIDVKTAPGFCLGLVDAGEGLIKPRYALQVNDQHILLTDMGGWKKPYNGEVYILVKENKKWSRKPLLNAINTSGPAKCVLDRTQQLVRGPNDEIYLTSAQCIAKVNPFARSNEEKVQVIIPNLPTIGLHASKIITFDQAGNILMNVGSLSDNCELEPTNNCQELTGQIGRGVIRKYLRQADGTYNLNYSIFATGQRNSMALYWDSNGNALWAGENSRDYIERKDSRINGQEKPSDEFNVIHENDELDWPYCYDQGIASPEFAKSDCSRYVHPHLLFPAHSAPLSFLMYTGSLFPKWYQNRLLISFHGYTGYGHRIVTYKRNEQLLPVGDPLSVVYGWDATSLHGDGSPVGLTQGLDGSVFIVEDTNLKVLQLYYNANEGAGSPVAELKLGTVKPVDSQLEAGFKRAEETRKKAFEIKLKNPNPPLFSQIQSRVIDQNCVQCHGGMNYPSIQLLKYDDIGNYKKLKEQLWARLNGDGVPQMPPSGLPEDHKQSLLSLVKQWVDAGTPAP